MSCLHVKFSRTYQIGSWIVTLVEFLCQKMKIKSCNMRWKVVWIHDLPFCIKAMSENGRNCLTKSTSILATPENNDLDKKNDDNLENRGSQPSLIIWKKHNMGLSMKWKHLLSFPSCFVLKLRLFDIISSITSSRILLSS